MVFGGLPLLLLVPLRCARRFGPLWILGMPFFRYFPSTFHINPEKRDERTVSGRGDQVIQVVLAGV